MSSIPGRLPHGRHGLTREEVERSQRDRLLLAAAAAMSEKGYARTVVEDIVKRAGVSRETFYRLFGSKLDCFMAAFQRAGELLISHITASGDSERTSTDPVERFAVFFQSYLEGLAANPTFARLFLVEVHAAGPEAIEARLTQQTWFVNAVADLFGVQTEQGRFACQMVVAATSAMLTGPLVSEDMEALRALGPRITNHVRELYRAGLLT